MQYAEILNVLGNINLYQGNYSKAENLYNQTLQVKKEFSGINDSDYAAYLSNLAKVYSSQRRYDDAEHLYLKVLGIQENILGSDNINCTVTKSQLANLYVNKFQFEKAELLYLQVISIQKMHLAENDIRLAITMSGLATLYQKIGNFHEAEKLFLVSLKIFEKLERTQNYAIILNNVAGLYLAMGKYDKAGQLYKSAMEEIKDKYGIFHPDYITFQNNLSIYYLENMLYNEAFGSSLEALMTTSAVYGKTSLQYVGSLNTLAVISSQLLLDEIADSTINEGLQICEELKLDTLNPAYYQLLDIKAILCSNQRKYDEAEKLYKQLINIKSSIFGKGSLEYAGVCENLGTLWSNQHNFDLAKPYFEKALSISKKVQGENHPLYIKSLNGFAMACHDNKKYDLAEKYYIDSSRKLTQQIKSFFSYLSTNERYEFWENTKAIFNIYDIFAIDRHFSNPGISKFAYNNQLFIKGLLLKTSSEIQRVLLNSNDSSLINNLTQLKFINTQIQDIFSKPNKESGELLLLFEKANSIDKLLSQKSQAYRQGQSELQINWQDVQSKLKEGEAAIEFLSFPYYHRQWTDSTVYCALVLKKGMEYPVMIPLFEQKQLDNILVGGKVDANNLYSSRSLNRMQKSIMPNGVKLYNLIWKPLEDELVNVNTVYYSPSGTLHQIAFAALSIDSTNYLCDKYNLVQLSSTRQLATSEWQNNQNKITSATLFGGIKYTTDKNEIVQLQQSSPVAEGTFLSGFVRNSTFCSGSFDFLEGTQKEVDAIASSFQSKNISTTLFTGIHGSEETFKSLNNKEVSVLHIATHGFFYPIETEKPNNLGRMILPGEQKFQHSPNPLLRSGLVFAGGNRTWLGEEPVIGIEDGIITAQEISEMYLPNTELVVLSACETGLGDVNGGEGVFGLQRAFKLAGAKTIIMSLWEVPDDKTSELMKLFYNKWLSGYNKRSAFQEAQKELRMQYPGIKPKNWAGFVMVD